MIACADAATNWLDVLSLLGLFPVAVGSIALVVWLGTR